MPSPLESSLQAVAERPAPVWQVMWSQVDGYVRCDLDLLGHHVTTVSRSKKRALVYALQELSLKVASDTEEL